MAEKHDKMEAAEDKKIVKKAMSMHDKQMHGGKKTNLKSLKKGGPTTDDRMKYGRNMSRAMNQRSNGRGG